MPKIAFGKRKENDFLGQRPGKVIAVTSPAGSTGKTTVAINLASELATNSAKVLLIDFDLLAPSLAIQLGLQDRPPGLLASLRLAGQNRLDSVQLERLSLFVKEFGFSVLTAGKTSIFERQLDSDSFGKLLEVAALDFDFLVLDLASLHSIALDLQPNLCSLISNSDELVIVAMAEPIGIYRLLAVESKILELKPNPRLILNRVRNSVIPQAKKEITHTLERLSKLTPGFFLPDDQSVIDAATSQARPVALAGKGSSFRAAIASFTRSEILGLKGALDVRLAKLG